MANLRFVVSLITTENDYQLEQAATAQAARAAPPRPELGRRPRVLPLVRGHGRLGGGGLGDDDGWIAVACGPRGLAGGARAFDDDDHAAIVGRG